MSECNEGMAADLAERRAKALAIASRISSTVLGKHARSDLPSWPVSDGSSHTSGNRKSVKIYLPKDNGLNYFGLLIGPGGQTLKDMERQSGAKLTIRGKGSSKDGNDECPDEDLHVVVEGQNESQVSLAERLINDLLFNRDKQSQVKEDQLRTVAERKTGTLVLSDRLYAADVDYPPFRGAGDKSKVINVAASAVGQIIGRGGETIKMLQTKTGAFIQVSRESDPTSNMKTVTLEGTASQIEHAEDEIMRILHENEQRDQMRGSFGGGAGVGFGADISTEIVRIPHDAVGLLIGKGGLTIKQMQMRTGCSIQVQRDIDADPSAITRDVTLSGTDKQIEDAKNEVLALVQGHPTEAGPLETVAPGTVVITLMIPGTCVGGVIGRMGETIKAIQQRSGARVQVSRDASMPEREITVSGTDHAVQVAKSEIENIVADNQARESGDRGDRHRRSSSYGSDGFDYSNDPYSRQAATYGSDQYFNAYGAYYGAPGYGMFPGYYPGYDPAVYGAAAGAVAAAGAKTEDTAAAATSGDQPAEAQAPSDPNSDPDAQLQQWQQYCMQYYAYYGQYPPEAYGSSTADSKPANDQPVEAGSAATPSSEQSNDASPVPSSDKVAYDQFSSSPSPSNVAVQAPPESYSTNER